ncbi:hypothetical protein JYU34_003005 [Plutella xylostella]|uniref:Uncharacterized protein n=1 Tax=Plutella xylostella TaxID=51655 RepID=A0ABQ7R3N6_PLUXY|nr:hypothetical protein JYU34_003005 [Plutella xylostella]
MSTRHQHLQSAAAPGAATLRARPPGGAGDGGNDAAGHIRAGSARPVPPIYCQSFVFLAILLARTRAADHSAQWGLRRRVPLHCRYPGTTSPLTMDSC